MLNELMSPAGRSGFQLERRRARAVESSASWRSVRGRLEL